VAIKQIGSGNFASVWKAKHRRTGELVALKNIDRTKLSDKRLQLEIDIMRMVEHPNVVRLVETPTPTETNQVMVLEYCNHGDLFQYIQLQRKGLSEPRTRALMTQLVQGLRCLRQHGILHRDLKPQNLMLMELPNRALVLKVADFGYARFYEPATLMETHVGSPIYMAPEMLANEKYTEKADIWSVGVTMYMLLTLETPYTGRSYADLVTNIQTQNFLFRERGACGHVAEGGRAAARF
jgi:serine/threonine-protein kinase ULK/ATG1